MKKTIEITKEYLWIPVCREAAETKIEIFYEKDKIQEMMISTDEEKIDYYAALPVSLLKHKKIGIKGNMKKAWFDIIKQSDQKPAPEGIRPLLHYAPVSGWMNDPNGLIFKDGVYHMYHQHNPYGVKWNNMHWSHTTTKDFISYTETELVLFPDKDGPIFSGTAICDKGNLMGYGKDTVLYFYTCAGDKSDWSKNKKFTQRLAYSTDNGRTLKKSDRFFMDHIAEENRDPKVFYHEESKAYIMLLYLKNDTFGIYRSIDLKNFIETDCIYEEGMWECPDLFMVTEPETKKKKWVFWSADGYYMIGEFDGHLFKSESKRLCTYAATREDVTKFEDMRRYRPYAAQTFSGLGDRILQLAWIVSQKEERNYRGQFSIPIEIRLMNTKKGERLSLLPAVEINYLHKKQKSERFTFNKETPFIRKTEGAALDLFVQIKKQKKGKIDIICFRNSITVDFTEKKIKTVLQEADIVEEGNYISLRIFVDRDIIEIFAQKGLSYFIAENVSDDVNGYIVTQTQDAISGTIDYNECNPIMFQ